MTTDPAAVPARPDRRAGKTPEQLWADGIAHLKAFIAEHGHVRVPGTFVCADGMRLGSWVMHRREDRRLGADRLTPDRIAQLDDLGFDWAPPRPGRSVDDFAQQWAATIERLTRYRDEYGHLDVPHRWECEDGFRLGAWVSRRRTDRRRETPTLTPERIAQLDAIGFDWGTTNRGTFEQQRWANAVARLANYVAEHGHARVPHRFTCPDGFRLGLWVFTRRADRRHGRQFLTPERITELDNLGFDWGTTRAKR
ncbi:helicase associated domain-containing protein [Rhodococcus sp. (in: high G+C Gram-positive bacteria)]|uniref:helicase associated domain-containing protein n=1 Tax=Rhodococcus sp. TaxID=1831 RepID=UPI003B8A5FF8